MVHDRRITVLILLMAGVLLAMVWSVGQGAVQISMADWATGHMSDLQARVVSAIRLPRVLMAALVGAALALAGAVLQGVFRNPLADPALLGLSAGAALGVALVLVWAGPLATQVVFATPVAAFIGCLLCSIVMMGFARTAHQGGATALLLAGIAVNALAGAATSFMIYISDDQQIRAITFWMMGSLGSASWATLMAAAAVVFPAALAAMCMVNSLNVMLLGEGEAQALGLNTQRVRFVLVVLTALLVAAAVAMSGIIGFIGLAAPHLVRLTLGPDHRFLLPISAVLGALILIVADTVARTVVQPAEMPVGILTALLGGPFFLWLLSRHHQNGGLS